jgi:two-component sensor histidine kinase/DNA-binding response OmpR family regulator
MMDPQDKVNILLVDDQPGKLLSHEVMLEELGEKLIKTSSAKEALEALLKTDVAVILIDVCMPELDGFELAAMIRDHPRFQRTSIIFISAIHISEADSLRGYDAGAVDYVSVPVVPEVLRAKVRVFCELHRKTKLLERLNAELETRVADRTAALEASNTRLRLSEQARTLALAAGNMGSWEYDFHDNTWRIDEGQCRIFAVNPRTEPTPEHVRALIQKEDWDRLIEQLDAVSPESKSFQSEMRVVRANGEMRWCLVAAAVTFGEGGHKSHVAGVTIDITERKETEEKQSLLAREVDHRARNALAVVQAIVRMSHAPTMEAYAAGVEGRIRALSLSHDLLSKSRWQGADITKLIREEVEPYQTDGTARVQFSGPSILLPPDNAQTIALAIHELATNAAKYGGLSQEGGSVDIRWQVTDGTIRLVWREKGGPLVEKPSKRGFGTKIIDASINSRSGGSAKFAWHLEGLSCELIWPHSPRANLSQPPKNLTAPTADSRQQARSILVVEDEPIVGMLTRDLLSQMGYAVMGPLDNIEDALRAGGEADLHCAILDVNLAGMLIFPVAKILAARDIPFIFLTGYDESVIDNEYRCRPILRKPIDSAELEAIVRSTITPEGVARRA